ncbi:MAG TPA: ECF transporter S component [Thermomicrobiaceae bacterium]|nr:ECF transporter S component [Thermomicrobiaceae bacterium]
MIDPAQGRRARLGSPLIWLASLAGALSFLYPFLLPAIGRPDQLAGRGTAVSLLFALLAVVCLATIVLDVQGRAAVSGPAASKLVALLGVLVAVDAALRLIPSFLGASPIFLLIVLVGYAYGADFGFLMGSVTLLVSAFVTGGLGPWLPFQMLTSGWVGMTAGWLPRLRGRRELAMLVLFGALWGFLFGAIMNLWEWPFAAPGLSQPTGLYWVPGMSALTTLHTYARFYLVTSLVYDLFRAVGNAVLLVLLARPVLLLLDRFRVRFSWEPWVAEDDPLPRQPEPAHPAT